MTSSHFFCSEISDGDRASIYLDEEVSSSENGSIREQHQHDQLEQHQQQQQQQEDDQSDEEHHPSVAELLAAAKSSKYLLLKSFRVLFILKMAL